MNKTKWFWLAGVSGLLVIGWAWGQGGADAGAAGAGAEDGAVRKPDAVSLRIQLGLKDQEESRWDGSLRVAPGRVARLEIWRKGKADVLEGTTWKLGTRSAPRFKARAKKPTPDLPVANGVLVTLDDVTAESIVTVATKQGEFSFQLADVPFGQRLLSLDGAADVIRIPVSYQVTTAATEEDYPSAVATPDGTVYAAYTAFTHGKDFAKRTPFGDEEPRDLSNLNQPTGGDQVFLQWCRGGRWSPPLPATQGGEDLYKTALAVDGRGRVWVFWSGQQDGNFDLHARPWQDGKWGKPLRLTKNPGPDINPAAATDSQGRVWVTWQGFRGDNANILALRQQGEAFGEELVVTAEPANEWEPAIAVAKSGDVAIAWDTYANGNYDVYFRVARQGDQLGPPIPVAASTAQEAHAAVTYDGSQRLWVAWEQGPEQWGKDFGAMVQEQDRGAPLYGGGPRTVMVKCFDGAQAFAPQGELADVLQPAAAKPGAKAKPAAKAKPGAGRKPGQERQAQAGAPISQPRLATDSAGRVWLAYRSKTPQFWCGVGTAWFEYLTCYQGDQWLTPVYVHHTDNILDNRPVLVTLAEGRMLLVGSADGRQQVSGYNQALGQEPPQGAKAEPVNNDLYVAAFGLGAGPADPPQLTAVPAEVPAEPVGRAEKEAVARCRSYRLQIGNQQLQLMRGEFHRHTELSTDGGGDGALIDMYRYGLDAASMDWIGNGDHDNNNGREYPWWIVQKTADAYHVGTAFVPMFSYERSVSYPDGHRNPIFAQRGVRTLPRFRKPGSGRDEQQPEHTPDTQLLYRYLQQFDGLCASHTSGTDMGTDWRDNNPQVEPVVEIYQGCRQNYEEPNAPRAPTADDAIGGWRPNGFVWNALAKGYRLGFQSSSDHVSTHISYCNVWAEEPTREAIFRGLQQRHVYGATDNIIADVRCGEHLMGDEFTLPAPPTLKVKLIGSGKFKAVDIVRNNAYVYHVEPGTQEVEFSWTEMAPAAGTAYYYVRGQQEDGQLVWVSPMWITIKAK